MKILVYNFTNSFNFLDDESQLLSLLEEIKLKFIFMQKQKKRHVTGMI